MSELVSMEKIPKTDRAKLNESCAGCCPTYDEEKFPYGLKLRFQKDELDKLPSLKLYKIDDKIIITAEASVTEVSKRESTGGEDSYTVELQIEKISCEAVAPKSAEQLSPVEYRAAREEKRL